MIAIKDYSVLKNMLRVEYHPTLIALAIWVATRYSDTWFTSAYREGDKGIHGTIPCRALDIRSHHFDDPFSIEQDINKHWHYDPKRPKMKCALYHDVGRGAHIHLQVHPRTEYIADDLCN